jgi:hypothetical protein
MTRFFGIIAALLLSAGQAPGWQNTILVSLTYDFSVNNACATPTATGCLLQFNIYDVTVPASPVKLFSVPAPASATGAAVTVSGTGSAALKAGGRSFGATAAMADGTESVMSAPTAVITVHPGQPSSVIITLSNAN